MANNTEIDISERNQPDTIEFIYTQNKDDEQTLLESFRKLNSDNKQKAVESINKLLEKQTDSEHLDPWEQLKGMFSNNPRYARVLKRIENDRMKDAQEEGW